MQIELILTLLLLVGLCLLATVDMAFNQLSDVGIRRLITVVQEREKHRTSEFLKQVLEDRPRFSFAITATIQILLVAISVLITSLALKSFDEPRYVLLGLAGGLVLVWIFRQFIPLFISTRNPEGTLLFLLPVIRPVLPVMALATGPLHRLFNRSRTREQELENGVDDDDEDSGDDIQALIDVGEAEGILEEEEGERIHAMIEFGETLVSEVMTPRPDIVAVPAEASVRDARDVMVESKYSRLPVYREQIDNVEGLIYVRDLMERWAAGDEEGPIAPLVREVYFVPETKPVDELLEEMQKAHVQLSMVVDEYGGVCGLVTVEDILEEIVGEIEDEDIGGEELQEIVESNGSYEVLGSTEIGKIERLFDMEIETDDFTTIAGLVINESGKVPQPGEQLKFRGLDVEVLEADERRIGRLRVKRSENGNDSDVREDH
ncbi:MAG TPA: hemolysin family protein [Pyrinomonadaceae bacterium]|nr:hemolysin family protein [Pyrinomonadaceae bacterium]